MHLKYNQIIYDIKKKFQQINFDVNIVFFLVVLFNQIKSN